VGWGGVGGDDGVIFLSCALNRFVYSVRVSVFMQAYICMYVRL